LYATAGLSWRLDRHQDSFVYKNAPKESMSKKTPNRKGFFSKLFKKKRN